jgi:hypothetical protein
MKPGNIKNYTLIGEEVSSGRGESANGPYAWAGGMIPRRVLAGQGQGPKKSPRSSPRLGSGFMVETALACGLELPLWLKSLPPLGSAPFSGKAGSSVDFLTLDRVGRIEVDSARLHLLGGRRKRDHRHKGEQPMRLEYQFSHIGWKYGYITWRAREDAQFEMLFGDRSGKMMTAIVLGHPLPRRRPDWKRRRLSIGQIISRALPPESTLVLSNESASADLVVSLRGRPNHKLSVSPKPVRADRKPNRRRGGPGLSRNTSRR